MPRDVGGIFHHVLAGSNAAQRGELFHDASPPISRFPALAGYQNLTAENFDFNERQAERFEFRFHLRLW